MTVILKSDVKASVSMGNINGINAPQDWSAFLDFENDIYSTKSGSIISNDYNINDVISASRPDLIGSPVTIDRYGNESTVSSLTQIRTALLKNGRFGLLSEDTTENFFINSSAPTTQTITLPASKVHLVAVSCEGTGSLTITGNIKESGKVVTSAKPQLLTRVSDSEPCVITVTVAGTLSHAQVEIVAGSLTATSKIKTTVSSATRSRETVKLKPSFFNSIITNKGTFTVAVQTVDYNQIEWRTGVTSNCSRLGIDAGTAKLMNLAGIYSDGRILSYLKQNVTSTNANTNNPAVFGDIGNVNDGDVAYTAAISINNSKADAAFNGVASNELALISGFTANEINMGTGYPSPTAQNGLRGIVTKMVIYNRALSKSELVELSSSWK